MTSAEVLELAFPRRMSKRTVWILLTLLILWSFGLRLWFATPDPNSTRYWDERYGLENLEPLLKRGQLRPVHGFHPGFSYLPHGVVLKASDLLYRATGWQKLAIFDARGRYTATAYMICRTLSVLFGTSTLLLLFLIGRRLGGDRLGLLAAFLLSTVPWHLRQSVLFKADIALLFTVVLTVYLSLRAIERPGFRSFAATGVGIGLALSSKFNAGPVAIPLTVGALIRKGSKTRALALLIGAALVSVAVFVALQPYILIDPEIYRRSMRITSRVYERVAAREGHGRLYLLWHLIETLASDSFFGLTLGSLAVVGLAVVAWLALRHRQRSTAALPWLMVLSYVLGYTVLYAVATPRPSPHNWLPVSPFAALGAGWAICAFGLTLSHRYPARALRWLGAAALSILVVALAWNASLYTYRETVPGTAERVLDLLRTRVGSPEGRHVVTEHDLGHLFQKRHTRGRLAIQTVADLTALSVPELDASDVEVFTALKLEEPTAADFYRGRMNRLKSEHVVIIEPRIFRAWGPALIALVHPWRQVGEVVGQWSRSDEDRRIFDGRFAAGQDQGIRYSVVFAPPRRTKVARLLIGDRALPLIEFRGPRLQKPVTSPRFDPTNELRLRFRRVSDQDEIPFTLRLWRPSRRHRADSADR